VITSNQEAEETEPRMNTPSLRDRQTFWMWAYALEAFVQTVGACDYLLAAPPDLPDAVRKIILTGIVVTYARPFTRGDGVQALRSDMVPQRLRCLHNSIIEKRHKERAHTDAQGYQADDPEFGNINQIRVRVSKDRADSEFIVMTTEPPLSELRQLASELREKAYHHTDRFMNKYIERCLSPGEYKVAVDPAGSEPFIKVKPPSPL
jgi:hypothetical protein